ncbi:hypothetical protein [Breoghania sp.]|uniref:hypothetical protein n=1 Tax=Breoghania sp. TaxID=2065378 RepID=UPI002612BBD5|nr:hypothetical protein [Breoghania sp.]MDJ0931830.1 hypothetical protein [Breoghania sp.]
MSDFEDQGFDLPFDDLTRFSSEMNLLNSAANDFSRVLSSALKGVVSDGKQLDDVLRQVALSFSSSLVSRSLSSLASSVTSGLTSLFSGGSATAFAKGERCAPSSRAAWWRRQPTFRCRAVRSG